MEITSIFFFLATVSLSSAAFVWLLTQKNRRRQPPGPKGWPIIGNILDLGTIPHQTLYTLKSKYGAVVCLKLGSVNTLVIQSAEAAADFFKNHDHLSCDRRSPASFDAHSYNKWGITLGKYGTSYWRMARRLYSMELMVTRRINDMASFRRKCIDNMIRYMEEDSTAAVARGETGELDMSHFLFLMAFNLVGNLVLSRDLLDSRSEFGIEFSDAMDKVMKWGIMPNLSDFFPGLRWMDLQGIKRNMEKDMGRALKIISELVKQRIEERKKGEENVNVNKDFLDVLLEQQNEGKDGADELTEENLTVFILEMFFAGSDTSSNTLEWAMSELLRKPETMKKAKEEIYRVIGPNKKVEENDVEQLPYLQAVIKETLRLHPPATLLLPRSAMEETNFMGYVIPKNTQIWVNAWAIGRDPDAWEEPMMFKPERFLGSKIDYKGQHYGLIPFGSGRRICVGMPLAHRVLHLALATMLQYFDWELPENMSPQDLDMSERLGILVRKLKPLKAIPRRHVF